MKVNVQFSIGEATQKKVAEIIQSKRPNYFQVKMIVGGSLKRIFYRATALELTLGWHPSSSREAYRIEKEARATIQEMKDRYAIESSDLHIEKGFESSNDYHISVSFDLPNR